MLIGIPKHNYSSRKVNSGQILRMTDLAGAPGALYQRYSQIDFLNVVVVAESAKLEDERLQHEANIQRLLNVQNEKKREHSTILLNTSTIWLILQIRQ